MGWTPSESKEKACFNLIGVGAGIIGDEGVRCRFEGRKTSVQISRM